MFGLGLGCDAISGKTFQGICGNLMYFWAISGSLHTEMERDFGSRQQLKVAIFVQLLA